MASLSPAANAAGGADRARCGGSRLLRTEREGSVPRTDYCQRFARQGNGSGADPAWAEASRSAAAVRGNALRDVCRTANGWPAAPCCAIWTAFGLLLISAAAVAAHQALLYRVLIPVNDLGRYHLAQSVGTLTSLREPAPDFTVTMADGGAVRLSDLQGGVVLLCFFTTSSEPCDLELTQLRNIWNTFHGQPGFQMLAIGRDESVDAVREFGRQHGFTFPLAADPDRSVFGLFASEGVPRLYLISRREKSSSNARVITRQRSLPCSPSWIWSFPGRSEDAASNRPRICPAW